MYMSMIDDVCETVADSESVPEVMASKEKHFQEWRNQMTKVVERLQLEAEHKDIRIAE